MIYFHTQLEANLHQTLTLRDLLHCAELFVEQQQRGKPFNHSISISIDQVYRKYGPSIVKVTRRAIFDKVTMEMLSQKPLPKSTGLTAFLSR